MSNGAMNTFPDHHSEWWLEKMHLLYESFSRKFTWSWFHGKNTLDVLYPQNVRVHLKKYHYTTLKQTMTMMSNQQWWCEKKLLIYLYTTYIIICLFLFFWWTEILLSLKLLLFYLFITLFSLLLLPKSELGKKLIFIYNTI